MPHEDTPSSSDAVRALKERLSKLETTEGRSKGLVEFVPKEGDVIIATPPKSGTTVVCQIAHSLRTAGDWSFEEINIVIPCLEMAWDAGIQNLEADQVARPRMFKTHAWYPHCPKGPGVKFIYVVRSPPKAVISFYHFLGGWFFDKNEIDINEFSKEFVLRRGAPTTFMQNASLWDNIASWYPHRHDPNVLWLFYEDIVAHKEEMVRRIANFLDLDDSMDRVEKAIEQSSLEFMQQHPTKYDEHMLKMARNQACMDCLKPLGSEKSRPVKSAGRVKGKNHYQSAQLSLSTRDGGKQCFQ